MPKSLKRSASSSQLKASFPFSSSTNFLAFKKQKRDQIKKKHPGLKNSEILNLIKKEWSKLTQSEKNNFKKGNVLRNNSKFNAKIKRKKENKIATMVSDDEPETTSINEVAEVKEVVEDTRNFGKESEKEGRTQEKNKSKEKKSLKENSSLNKKSLEDDNNLNKDFSRSLFGMLTLKNTKNLIKDPEKTQKDKATSNSKVVTNDNSKNNKE